MSNLNESSSYETNVPSIETSDDVVGSVPAGDPNLGIANVPHVKLANRTKYLKTIQDAQAVSITNIQNTIIALNAGKANKESETHTGEHKFTGPVNREFIPVPTSQARAVKAWEFGFGLKDIGNGVAALTSKNLIEAVSGVVRLKYTDYFGLGLSGVLVYHNTYSGAGADYRFTNFSDIVLIISQDAGNPYSLVKFTKDACFTVVKSDTFHFPTNSGLKDKWLTGGYEIECLETTLDDGGDDGTPPIIGAFSDFAGGKQEVKVFIRNGHSTGKLDYLQGWLTVRALPKLIATVV